MHSPGVMTAIPRYIIHLVALILLIQGVHAGCISGTISGEPLLFTDPESLSGTPESVNETVMARMAALPLSFIPNEGQTDPAVRFMVKGSGTSFSFTNTGMLFSMQPSPNETPVVITQNYIEASESARVSGEDLLPGTANYFIGDDPENWRSNIPTYGAVRYHDLYPGIDLLYKGNGSVLKREFFVAPGSDPSLIRMEYEGADSLLVDESGSLNIIAGAGTMTESGPVCFQEIEGTRVDVGARYVLSEGNELTIAVDAYDPAYELVIDPELEYSTYLGGSGGDWGYGIAVDGSGTAYVTGYTSGNFPTKDPYQTAYGGGDYDAFVTKLNAAGSELVYSTYLGGAQNDWGWGIAVDANGNAYVTGRTLGDFPTTTGAYQETHPGGRNAFVTKLNPAGSELLYSTYLGGGGLDDGRGIAVDSSGNAYVAGRTSGNFPTTEGAYQTEKGGGDYDAFVTKLNAAGSELVYSTYLGGGGKDEGYGIAVDGSGNAYVTGYTSGNFPTKDPYQTAYGGGYYDAFVTKLNAEGSGLVYSTYLGGSSDDEGYGIAVDSSGNAYVTGNTKSENFPTEEPYQTAYGGGYYDAFVTKLNAAGSELVYSTYLGGGGKDEGYGIAVDSSGNAYVTGNTEGNFPTTPGANQTAYGGGNSDAFVTKLKTDGSELLYSTYLGGGGKDEGRGIAVDSSDNAYVTGNTISGDFPTTTGAYQTAYGGSNYGDAFVTKSSLTNAPPPTITSISPSTGVNTGPVSVTITGTNFDTGATTVRLTRPDQTAITATDVNRVSETQITCNLPITNAATGEWDVELTMAGWTVTRENGFTVTAPPPSPTITSISPSTGVNTGPVSVTITGTNFAGGATVKLTRSGQTDIDATDVNRVSETQITCNLPITGALPGDWNVVLTTAGHSVGLVDGFTVTAPTPTITSISPSTGVNTGPVSVTITGTNFAEGATVKLTREGQTDIDATDVSLVSESLITCTLPITGALPGDWNVVLTTAGQTVTRENGFTVTAPPPSPTITSISPSTGVNTGPVSITFNGTNFATGATTVRLTREGQSDIDATDVSVVSETEITCTLPITGAATGEWNVVLTTAGQTVTRENGFTVTAPPTITSINPSTGVNTGPVGVTITGTNFAEGATVKLTREGQTDINATDVNRVSATNITCTLPITNAATGDWNVVLTTAGQTVTRENGFTVTAPTPTITSISPSTGYNTGRLATTITGTNFRAGVTAQLTRGATRINGAVSAVTNTRFNAAFPLLGAPSGKYTLTVTNTDRTSATGTFTVRAEQYASPKRWGKPGSANNQFRSLKGIAVDRNGWYIYVADTNNHRVVKYHPSGSFVKTWGTRGAAKGRFLNPTDIAVDRNNNVYVADTGNHRIQKFNANGRLLKTWGTRGAGNNQLRSPAGIGVDKNCNVYVADTGNHRIVKYNRNGKFIKKWGTRGKGNGRFVAPRDVAVDNRGFIYVADTGNHRIQKLRPNGAFLTTWGQAGAANGRFRLPSSIDVDSNNFVYVADTNNHRIQKFSNTGAFLTKWGAAGAGPRQMRAPQGLAVNAAGLVYVADTGNHRVSVWRKPAGSLSVESVEEVTPVPTVVKSIGTPDVSRPVAAVPVVEMPVRAGHDIRPLSPAVVPQSPAPAGIRHGGIPGNPLA